MMHISIRGFIKKVLNKTRFTRIIYDRYKGRYIIKDVVGVGNSITIGEWTQCYGTIIRIRGNNNRLIIGSGCMIGNNCSFWISGDNIEIVVGNDSSFTCTCHINASESGSRIRIGQDAMFSNNIIVRTSDDHPIYDIESGKRINPAKDITIGEHVWIAPNTKIMKGAIIGDGSIIGSDTTVTHEVPAHCLAVGRPSKVVKSNIQWTRESLF